MSGRDHHGLHAGAVTGLPLGRLCLAACAEPCTSRIDTAGGGSDCAAVLLWGDSLLEHLSARIGDPRFGSLAAAALLFFLPTCISGMVSPYAVRLLVADRASAGQLAGRLYFVSTFGSAAGTILTSFYLVLYLEVNQILMLMLGVSELSV